VGQYFQGLAAAVRTCPDALSGVRTVRTVLRTTLADRGTFLALRKSLDLAILVEGGRELWNSYRVIVVNPEKHPRAREKEAKRLAEWLVTPAVQKAIGDFGREKYGQPLFVPDAK